MMIHSSRNRLGRRRFLPLFLLPVLAGTFAGTARADVRLAPIFGDHMVLQEETKIPVWGWADPAEKVTVTLGGASGSAIAGADGAWRVDLPPVPQNTAPQTLTVAGKNTLTFQDVLIGDVWVASGQSNMEFGIGNDDRGAAAIAQADEPQIRLFMVPKATSLDTKKDFVPVPPDRLEGKWQVCSPATLGGKWGWNGFSAAAFYFGREIHHVTNRPIGLIGTYWGGTPAQAWTSLSGLQQDPVLAHYVDGHQKLVDNYAQANAAYPKLKADFDAAMQQWNQNVAPAYNQALTQWKTDAANAAAANQPLPPQPQPSQPKPNAPQPPDGGPNAPTNLFNAMIAPLLPYAIKGAIWYQGEANTGSAKEYATLFPRMITDWREKWGQGDFPFLYVQLANFLAPQQQPVEASGWALLRESQLKTLALPNTGMATAVDIGDPTNIHPKDKLDVGLRLALAARQVAYGENVVSSGPLYDAMTVEGNKIRLTFKETGGGLTMGVPPWTPTGTPPPAPTELKGFAIAGDDKKWVWAKAEIDGNALVVSGDGVASPVAVRYDWASCPFGNFYNKEGLPALPFRTDAWEDSQPAPPKPAVPAPAAPTSPVQPAH